MPKMHIVCKLKLSSVVTDMSRCCSVCGASRTMVCVCYILAAFLPATTAHWAIWDGEHAGVRWAAVCLNTANQVPTTDDFCCLITGWPLVWKPGNPGNVKEFDSCQGNVRDFTKTQGSAMEKILSGKSCLKLFIVSCMFVSIQVFSTSTGIIWVTLNMPCAEECRESSGKYQGIVRKFYIVWRVVTLL